MLPGRVYDTEFTHHSKKRTVYSEPSLGQLEAGTRLRGPRRDGAGMGEADFGRWVEGQWDDSGEITPEEEARKMSYWNDWKIWWYVVASIYPTSD